MNRGLAEIRADLAALVDELARVEAGEGGSAMMADDDGPIVSLKEAARRTGWKVERVKAHVTRRRLTHPDEPPIGFQPGGVRNAPWCVRLGRFEASIVGQTPQRTTTSTN